MAREIFRKAALDRLASPERLDVPLRLVGRPAWLILLAIALGIGAALAWASVTRAPVKIAARGILIDKTGLAEIVADDEGRIERMLVAPGDLVRQGQPIATVARKELARQIDDARAQLAAAQARYGRLSTFYGTQNAREAQANQVRLATIQQTRAALHERQTYLSMKIERMRGLVVRGFIRPDQLVDVQIELANVRERDADQGEAALRLQNAESERGGTSGLALLDAQKAVDEQQRNVTRLTERLSEQQVVRSTHGGQVTEVKVNPGDVIGAGTALATIAPAGMPDSLVALLYVPATEGKRIQPGMEAELVPTTVEKSLYGHIPGKVISVAPLPATSQGIRRILQNDQLVQDLLASGTPIEVRVWLARADTPSGFTWSASKGPRQAIGAGSIVTGSVVIERRRVIGLLLPRAGN